MQSFTMTYCRLRKREPSTYLSSPLEEEGRGGGGGGGGSSFLGPLYLSARNKARDKQRESGGEGAG